MKEITKSKIDKISYEIIGAAIEVHKRLGPGLLESIYHKCMKIELEIRGLKFETELKVPIVYEGCELESTLRCDLFVENLIPVELKSVIDVAPVFEAQILTYMRLLNAPKGILINFNCKNVFHDGQKTFVNAIYRNLPAE
jgi:GxxExxY protein